MTKFFAVGWQPPTANQLIGQLDNFRQAHLKSGFEDYVSALQFSNEQAFQGVSLIEKFEAATGSLENVETNGNNTEVPFCRKVTDGLTNEFIRCSKVTEQLMQELNPITDFDKIRLYILTTKVDDIEYRFYIKALRTAKLNTRFILTALDKQIIITDTEGNGKALPYVICYAEKIDEDTIIQYVFNVQDYEAIFGINESKLKSAKANYCKFLSIGGSNPEFKVSGEFVVNVPQNERAKIESIIEEKRKIANALSKYNNEASEYAWEDVKKANSLSEEFLQTPFAYDEAKKEILLTAESFEAWVSVISNTKKLAIASNQVEDRIADRVARNA